jgi:hypothetical protein
VTFNVWLLAIPFALALLVMDESRKWLLRGRERSPGQHRDGLL